jgi:hypothetical protein
MLSDKINPADMLARIKSKTKPEVVQVLALSGDGDMIVLRYNGEIRAVSCDEDEIVTSCETVVMRN